VSHSRTRAIAPGARTSEKEEERAMPTYELRCRKCGESIELTLHLDEYERQKGAGIECPKCHGKDVAPEIAPFEVRTSRKAASY
jgi:putative FmdB family regulatory protein